MNRNEMFPRKYAKGEDLMGKEVKVKISKITKELMGFPEEEKFVLYFEKAKKGVVLGPALFDSIVEATGQADTDNWPGETVILYPVPMTVAGVARVAIRAKKANGETEVLPPAMNETEIEEF